MTRRAAERRAERREESAASPAPLPLPLPLTRIVATLGPATDGDEAISRVIEAGVGVVRLNFSHGAFEDHARHLLRVRRVAERLGRTVAVLGDLRGPRIRVGPCPRPVPLSTGDLVEWRKRSPAGRWRKGLAAAFGVTEPSVLDDLRPGQRVLVADGTIRMRVLEVHPGRAVTRVEIGGEVRTGKGVNLPDTRLSVPVIGDHDREAIAWSLAHRVDFLALSFVRRAADLHELRRLVGGGPRSRRRDGDLPRLVAKIERPEAIDHLEAIVAASDAVMVARGDLGAEMGLEAVPPLQRRILASAHAAGRPAIVATEVLASMTTAATPTRAEVGDLSRAVLDEADAIMLSGETAIGRHPSTVVAAAASVLRRAERWSAETPHTAAAQPQQRGDELSIALAAWHFAIHRGAKMVVVAADEPELVRTLAQHNFFVPIAAVGLGGASLRRLLLYRGVVPVPSEPHPPWEAVLEALRVRGPMLGLPCGEGPWIAVGRLAGGGLRPIEIEPPGSAGRRRVGR